MNMLTFTYSATNNATYCFKIRAQVSGNAVLQNETKSTSTLSITEEIHNVTLKNSGDNIIFKPPMKKTLTSRFDDVIVTYEDEVKQSVKTIKQIMRNEQDKNSDAEELVMIDAIQRLGLEFFFKEEIDGVLAKHHERLNTVEDETSLHDVSLRFRLLRQQGYYVPAEIFGGFMDENRKFDPMLCKDTKGLMNLFEATLLSIPGDHILEDASEFSAHWLQILIDEDPTSTGMIRNTLTCPYYNSIPSLMAMNNNHLHNFERSCKALHDIQNLNSKWISEVQKLARIDMNMAKINYQNEISHLSRWWKKLGLTEELKYARSQPEKWHMWSIACFPNPDMGYERIQLSKSISLVYIIDDIFDVYGTIEELTLFTEAVKKWEYENVEGLPQYMKITLKALFDTTLETTNKICNKYGGNPKEFLQYAWTELCNAYLVEAKWFHSGQMPNCEDYLQNRIISTGVGVACASIFLLLGEANSCNNEDTIVNGFPKIAYLAAKILRLWNDFGSPKDKNENGYDGSFIACYMNEHAGSSIENARACAHLMIANAWKALNETCLSPSPYSTPYKTAILNMARIVPMMYDYDDVHRLPSLFTNA